MAALNTFVGGLLALLAAAGVGATCCRMLSPIPVRWRLAISLLTGIAIIDLTVLLALACGAGILGLKLVAACAAVIACYELLRSRNHHHLVPRLEIIPSSARWFTLVIATVIALNLAIAVAPSSKIDELFYHMLLPKRILADGGLYLYRQPFELGIFPQMSFQVGLSALHAVGFPESGNVISWGLSTVLILLITGIVTDLTRSTTAGWMSGAIAAVGLYTSVWHVTSGPHALGDLAMLTACLLALLPEQHVGELSGRTRLILIAIASCTAASTKISLLPLSLTLTAIGIYRTSIEIGWKKACATALGVWGVLYGPILIWTTVQSGSPFGLATAVLFHSSSFDPETIGQLEASRRANQTGWLVLLKALIPSVSAGMIGAFGVIAYAAFVLGRTFRVLAGLVVGQTVIIAWLLPHDFRFLGGLQFAVLVLGASVFWPSRLGTRLITRWLMVLFGLCLPWLAAQTYYAIPFLKVASSLLSRDSFRKEYVAFMEDFCALDRILPADAVIYVVNWRLPSYYAPRAVIFSLTDLRGTGAVYRFAVGSDTVPELNAPSCIETVYKNEGAVALTFRTPGRVAVRNKLRVERCLVETGQRGK